MVGFGCLRCSDFLVVFSFFVVRFVRVFCLWGWALWLVIGDFVCWVCRGLVYCVALSF